jgi:hypothetical protein
VTILCGQMHTLLHDSSGCVVLQVQQVLHVLGHCSHAGIEVGALEVRHGLKVLLPHGIFLILNKERHDRHYYSSSEAVLTHKEVSAMCAVSLMVVSGSLPMMVPIHGSVGLRDIVTLVSHMSRPSAIDRQQL